MKLHHKILLVAVLVAAFISVGGLAYYLHFYRQKAALDEKYASSESAGQSFKDWLDGRPSTDQKLNEIATKTLGFNAEVVDSRFRSGLSRLANNAGLVEGKTIITPKGSMTAIKNPTVDQRSAVTEFKKHLSEDYITAPDLYIMEAQVRGTGSFQAVTRLLALAQAQPWIWSVRGFTLKPENNEASLFVITVDVSTALLPDLAPSAPNDGSDDGAGVESPGILDPSADQISAIAAIVERNVFAPPTPTPPGVFVDSGHATAPPPDLDGGNPPSTPPPYHEWRLTGVSGSPTQGRLAWMLNLRTGSAVLLSPGESVLDAVLLSAEGAEAVFQIGDGRFTLALNETLADRRPAR